MLNGFLLDDKAYFASVVAMYAHEALWNCACQGIIRDGQDCQCESLYKGLRHACGGIGDIAAFCINSHFEYAFSKEMMEQEFEVDEVDLVQTLDYFYHLGLWGVNAGSEDEDIHVEMGVTFEDLVELEAAIYGGMFSYGMALVTITPDAIDMEQWEG